MKISLDHRALAAPIIGIAVVVLAACSSTSSNSGASPGAATSSMSTMPVTSSSASTTASASSAHNDADVSFATDMIPHHQQAVEMAQLAASRASSTAVKDLAKKIEAAQKPEITTMSAWLTTWGKPVPSLMGGMDMSGNGTMMSAADMMQLTHSKGAEFDRMFLTMMITHHKGAVAMAAKETAAGENADALALAKAIRTSQTAEVSTMQKLLTQG